MNSIPISPNDFFTKGAYVGNLVDFFNDDEINNFKNEREKLKVFFETQKDKIKCRFMYNDHNDDYTHSIPYYDVQEREKFIKENNFRATQKWHEFSGYENQAVKFVEITSKIVKYFYPNIKISNYPIGGFTLYEDTHFIEPHLDGMNERRICVLIMYLSDESEYNETTGGELVIEPNKDLNEVILGGPKIEYTIKPVFGTFSLLDFSKNNINHAVNEVKNGFKRYAFINFFYEEK